MSMSLRPAMLVLFLTSAPIHPIHASEDGGWTAEKPWNCVASADSCAKFSSSSHYVGPAYGDCVDITNGWKHKDYVEARCDND